MADSEMPDAPAATHTLLTEAELDEKFPNRPHNTGATLPFHDLYLTLFNPLNENKKKPTGPPAAARRKVGPNGASTMAPHERRRQIIQRFISHWRQEVGPDIYPAFRLILPDKDRDRPMYGLKEKAIGKLLVKVMRINPNSEDGFSLLNFKIPGSGLAARMAGDFAGRCYEVVKKRPLRTDPGNMSIGRVNELLDQLAIEGRETGQLPIFQEFYTNMNATELMWLVRIILRQMKVGATERTIFDIWHPDAINLYNVTSSLRRVCWDLSDPETRLDGEDKGITLMQCFQPQLAQFQLPSFEKMVERMRPTADDDSFWIEEKLDGERMQMHMVRDKSQKGGARFAWWSRKAKEYTYLYGSGFEDDQAALSRHLKNAFHDGVENLILDGEMITWDPAQDKMVPFGTLKTAALSAQRDPWSETDPRPLYAIFDILYLNDTVLTQYTLRDRRRALEASIKPIHRRFQIHPYTEAHEVSAIEPAFRKVVEEEAEGLVVKNPRAPYRLNERCDDWMKVKPDYLGFGETPDVVIIGACYGSGRRGGILSSFLCGLRLDRAGADPELFSSFCRVGGGMTVQDYATISQLTADKWQKWDPKKPPSRYILLGGSDGQAMRPDVWIRPSESLVIEIQAASSAASDVFHAGSTLRFPRFKRLRQDRDWRSALSLQGFRDMKAAMDATAREKQLEFQAGSARRLRPRKAQKREITIAGTAQTAAEAALHPDDAKVPATRVFEGLSLYILSDTAPGTAPSRQRTKLQLEALVKRHAGTLRHTYTPDSGTICIADRKVVHAAALQRRGDVDLVRPAWVLASATAAAEDCAREDVRVRPLPLEKDDLFHATLQTNEAVLEQAWTDEYGDSYMRPAQVAELQQLLKERARCMLESSEIPADIKAKAAAIRAQLAAHNHTQDEEKDVDDDKHDRERLQISQDPRLGLFANTKMRFAAHLQDARVAKARFIALFAGAVEVGEDEGDGEVLVVASRPSKGGNVSVSAGAGTGTSSDTETLESIAAVVEASWILESWRLCKLLDWRHYRV